MENFRPISRIYNNQEEIDLALSNITNLNTLMLDNKITNFHFDKAIENTSSNEILKPYLTKMQKYQNLVF